MAVDQGQGLARDLTNELFEFLVGAGPCFDFRDHIEGHVDSAGFGLLLEGQMPARSVTAWALEGAKRTLQERADLN